MRVVATAGHVDHGKSTLVRALTGMEPDRLAEERKRGLTIDLGYAWTTLGSGETVAFVDVPGHQRFISNMLAGVGPVPAAMFVVASDEGWCAQSEEHLRVLDTLRVSHGVLVLTRADLGDASLAEEEARTHLASSTLAGAEAVAVSAVTGAGLEQLRQALARMTARMTEPSGERTRLWVDRVFSVRGAGTVVTGTLASGAIRVDDQLQLQPGGAKVTIRSIQSLHENVQETAAVARVALNLRGVKAADVQRGDALTGTGQWPSVDLLDVRLGGGPGHPQDLGEARIRERVPSELLLHAGSAAVPARVRMLGADTARLTLARPLPLLIGERWLLRDPGSRRVLSATVLDPMPPALTRRGAARRRAADLEHLTGATDVSAEVQRRSAVLRSDLELIGAMRPGDHVPSGVVSAGGWLVDHREWARWMAALPAVVDAWAAEHPMRPGVPRQAVCDSIELPAIELVDALAAADPGFMLDSGGVHRQGRTGTLAPDSELALVQLIERLTADPFDAASVPELHDAGLEERVLNFAVQQNRLIRVANGVYLLPSSAGEAVVRLARVRSPFTVAEARAALGTSRRVAVPLLELLDRTRLTRRIDDQLRELAPGPAAGSRS